MSFCAKLPHRSYSSMYSVRNMIVVQEFFEFALANTITKYVGIVQRVIFSFAPKKELVKC